MPRKKKTEIQQARDIRRQEAESDLESFIKLVHGGSSGRLLGNIHREIIRWWTASNACDYQLLLLPRDHMKSALVAYRAAWELTKDPTLRILYISSTSMLAVKQLKFIKDILCSDNYRLYWPEMVTQEEAKREKWTEREIAVDHPQRKAEAIRDASIFTAGLTTNIVGLHCDIAILDDVVVHSNAYTEDGREKVKEQYSYLSSIEGVGAREWVVGTRYHPKDLYNDLIEREVEEYDEVGNRTGKHSLFDVKEEAVESAGDGTGQFLWPRQQRADGKWFGFDAKTLADKRAKYLNPIHFRAQYYNNPNDESTSIFKRDIFQYYDNQFLNQRDGKWQFKGKRLNVFAAIDFAFSLNKKADSTAIVVVGVDGDNNYYVLDIDRFKSDMISEYFKRILKMYEKWGFRKLRAEVTVGQAAIVKDIKENYIRPMGLGLSVEEFRPSKWDGAKEERILSVLEPKYANKQVWHYLGGYCQTLEEELIFSNPAHDDVKDALASAIDCAIAPSNSYASYTSRNPIKFHSVFGGVAF